MPNLPFISIRSKIRYRLFPSAVMAAIAIGLLTGTLLMATETVWAPPRSASDLSAGKARADVTDSAKGRIREGTRLVNQRGFFKQRGDGATFNADNGSFKIESLENLNLERVVRTIASADKPDEIEWVVSGTVTEFQSGNYLFINRAIQLSKTSTTAQPR